MAATHRRRFHLLRRGRTWHYRRRIPLRLHGRLRRQVFTCSLRTRHYREARRRASMLDAGLERVLELAEADETVDAQELIRSLSKGYFDRLVAEHRSWRTLWRGPEDRVGDEILAMQTRAEDEDERMLAGDRSKVVEDAKALLRETGATLGGEELDRLCWELQRAHHRAYLFNSREWEADLAGKPRHYEVPDAGSGRAAPRKSGKKLGEAAELFFDRHCEGLAAKTKASYRRELARFVEALGPERVLASIGREDVADFLAELGKSKDGKKPLAAGTLGKAMSHVHSLFGYAVKMEWIEKNPASGQVPKPSRREAKDARHPFTDEDLAAIFGEGFVDAVGGDDARYWLPLVLLYTGARREEIAQLAIDDVRRADGKWAIEIRGGDGKNLKTAQSERTVPVHSQLEQLGFVEYVDGVRRAGEQRVFPRLTMSVNGYGDATGKWFTRWKNKSGVTSTKKVMHSFRHTFYTRLKYAGVEDSTITELAGHENPNVMASRYGEALNVERLAEAVEKLDFAEPLRVLFEVRD